MQPKVVFISHNKGCQYYVGDYDTKEDRFIPNNHGRMTWVDNTYFAPEALIDGKGRQIMWAWLTDNPKGEESKGWSGVFGLPRSLWLGEDGTLRMRPVKELEMLRCRAKTWSDVKLAAGAAKAWSRDGKHIYFTTSPLGKLYSIAVDIPNAKPAPITAFHGTHLNCCALSPDQRLIAYNPTNTVSPTLVDIPLSHI